MTIDLTTIEQEAAAVRAAAIPPPKHEEETMHVHSGQAERHVSVERLMARLDGAELCMYDPDGYLLVWFGGESTGIHVYDTSGVEVGYWQTEAPTTIEGIRESMTSRRMSGDGYPS